MTPYFYIINVISSNEFLFIIQELDYYRSQHHAVMNQLEVSAQESETLRKKYTDIGSEKQRLEREIKALENGNADSLYVSLSRRNEAVRDDYEVLRKTYDDLLLSHSTAITKLELAQEETARLNKQLEQLSEERNNAVSVLDFYQK